MHKPTTNATSKQSLPRRHRRRSALKQAFDPQRSGQRQNATLATSATNGASATNASTSTSLRQHLAKELADILGTPHTIPIPRWVTPKHYSYTYSEIFGHASFILVAASYAVDDFVWLRIIAVAGSASMLVFTYFHPHGRVLWLPFQWNCLFIAINSYRIGRVYYDRYLADVLSPELKLARERHFSFMEKEDFGKLARIAHVETYRKGDLVAEENQPNDKVRVVLSGELNVMRDGALTYVLDEGNFIAESGLHAGLMLKGSVDSCCSVEAETDVQVISWDRTELVDLLEREDHLRRSLKATLSWDVVRKLKSQRVMLASGRIQDPGHWTHLRNEQGEHRYAAILKNLLASHHIAERKRELLKYRTVHHIDDEHHREALKACGWTEEEFEAGHKKGEDLHFAKKQHHGPDHWIRQYVRRVFG